MQSVRFQFTFGTQQVLNKELPVILLVGAIIILGTDEETEGQRRSGHLPTVTQHRTELGWGPRLSSFRAYFQEPCADRSETAWRGSLNG